MRQRCCPLMLLLFLVPAARAQVTCSNTNFCVLDCTGCTPGEMVPDPSDCTRFYVCDNGFLMFPDPFECPDGEVFNSVSLACEAGTTCTPCPPACSYDCNSPISSGEISSFYDCSIYYTCNGGVAGDLHSCPSSAPYYDGNTCQTNQSRCCHCHPYCYLGDTGHLVPDPTDCRKYYACNTDWEVPIYSGTCSSGQYFDTQLEHCSAAALCVTLCTNVIGIDGCIDPYTCQATGYFPKCPSQCTAEYYHCTGVSDEYIEASSCMTGYVFHPDKHTCIPEVQCPY